MSAGTFILSTENGVVTSNSTVGSTETTFLAAVKGRYPITPFEYSWTDGTVAGRDLMSVAPTAGYTA